MAYISWSGTTLLYLRPNPCTFAKIIFSLILPKLTQENLQKYTNRRNIPFLRANLNVQHCGIMHGAQLPARGGEDILRNVVVGELDAAGHVVVVILY